MKMTMPMVANVPKNKSVKAIEALLAKLGESEQDDLGLIRRFEEGFVIVDARDIQNKNHESCFRSI